MVQPQSDGGPMPPPRYKKKVKMRGIKNLNLESISNEDNDGEFGISHQNDILFNVCGSKALAKGEDFVKGNEETWPLLAVTSSQF